MTPNAAIEASSSFLVQLVNPAARALALAGATALGLAVFRVKATSVRLFTWTAVLYAALALPVLGWLLPPLPVPVPAFLQYGAEQYGAKYYGVEQFVPKDVRVSQPPAAALFGPVAGEALSARTETVEVASRAEVSSQLSSPSPVGHPAASASFLWHSIRWSTVAAGIYLTVAFLLLARLFVGLAFGRRLMQASRVIDEPRLTRRLAARACASGLAFIPQAAESELISVPVTIGALRSTILLPAGWREWDDVALDAVVTHEMSHVARRDALTQLLSLLHRAIFWFSPLACWLDRHLSDLAEQASDEAALSGGVDRTDYARTLLGFFEALRAAPGRVWWQGVSMAKVGQAEQRVERILAWKGSVAMRLKKSIAVVVLALAVPAVYLAASAHPAKYAAGPRGLEIAQNQTPPAPDPAHAQEVPPNATPAPTLAPTSDATPPPEPASQLEPTAAPAAVPGTISGKVSAMPPPGAAPVAGVAPAAAAHIAPASAMAPAPPLPSARWSGQLGTSGSSSGHGFSYSYGYDDDLRFVIVSGKTDSFTMSGMSEDAERVEKLRKTIQGDFIWFRRDGKSYIIRDQATIDRARKFWAPQEELGKKQEELGKQQEALGKQQEDLGAKMEQIRVNVPDMTAELDKLKAELKQLNSTATVEQIGHIQSEIGELQSKIGSLQGEAGEQQGKLGEEMGALGEKQGKLGEQQGELGRKQGELARQASRQMKQLLDEAVSKGTAQLQP